MAVNQDLFPKFSNIVTLTITYSIIFTLIFGAPATVDERNNVDEEDTIISRAIKEIQLPCGNFKTNDQPFENQLEKSQITLPNIIRINIEMQRAMQKLDIILRNNPDLSKFMGDVLLSELRKLNTLDIKNCNVFNSPIVQELVQRKQKSKLKETVQDKVKELHVKMEEYTFTFAVLEKLEFRKSVINSCTDSQTKFETMKQYLNTILCEIEQAMNDSSIQYKHVEQDRYKQLFNQTRHSLNSDYKCLEGSNIYQEMISYLNDSIIDLLNVQLKKCKKLKRKTNNKKGNKKLRKHKIKKHNKKRPKKPYRKKKVSAPA